jgi:hypothetical protein
VPKLTLFDYLPIADRVIILDTRFKALTGKYANIVYLPADELADLMARHHFQGEAAFRPANPPAMIEATLHGLFIRVDTYAKTVRVDFKES